MYYIIDSNIWIDVAQGKLACRTLFKPEIELALAPLMITELIHGVVRGGEARFTTNKAMFECMAQTARSVLELPKVFISGILWNVRSGSSGVRPAHYLVLMDMLLRSHSHAEFLTKTEQPNSPWNKMSKIASIHEGVLDKELESLKAFGSRR
jgi:hypothetical protein